MEQTTTNLIINFAEYITRHTQNFVGRTWVFEQIDAWLAGTSRFFLLLAEPGSGKTALTARLCELSQGISAPPGGLLRLSPDFISAYHFCSTRDDLWIDPLTFTRSIALQLSRYPPYAQAILNISERDVNIRVQQHIHDIAEGAMVQGVVIHNLTIANLNAQESFNRIVRDPLHALYRDGFSTPLLIVIDGLDEALIYAGRPTIVELLSRLHSLPSQVRFLLTSRSDPRTEEAFSEAERLLLSAPLYDQQNRVDISDYVRQRLAPDGEFAEKIAHYSAEQVDAKITTLTDKAAGNFQYISFLLQAIAQNQRTFEELEGLPEGLDALYADSLRCVVQLGNKEWTTDYAPLLGVLSVAQESLTFEQLLALTGQTERAVWEHINHLQQFIETVQVNEDDAEETQSDEDDEELEFYRLFHQSFIDFLRRRYTKKVRNKYYLPAEEWHKQVANVCEQGGLATIWQDAKGKPIEQGRREYARKYYVTHLYHGQEWQHLYTVLDEGEYGRAKINHDFNVLAYVRDLELGQQATMHNELSKEKKFALLPALWRYSLLRCSLSTLADAYPDLAFLVMVKLKQDQKALKAVEWISDDHRKARLLINIGVNLEEQGQKVHARRALTLAKDVMAGRVQRDPAIVQTILQEIAPLGPFALKLPFLDEIAKTAQLITDEEQRVSVLIATAVALSETGAQEKAEALACTISYTSLDSKTREKIVETLVKAQLWESATLLAQSILDDTLARNNALAEVIIGLLHVQEWEKAHELALTTSPSERFKAVAEVALTRARVEPEMVEELLKMLDRVPLASDQDNARGHAKNVTSQLWACAQQWDKAIAIMQTIYDDFWQNWAASKVLERMLKAQRWDKAIALASSQQNSFRQLEFLDNIVKALIDAQQVEHTREAIAKVAQSIGQREQNNEKQNDKVLLEVVTLLIKLQYLDDAQQLASRIRGPQEQCKALVVLADALSQEQPAQARQLLSKAESCAFSFKKTVVHGYDLERAGHIISSVVVALARMQLWDRAVALASTISTRWSTSDRDEAFTAIVIASSRTGAWKQAVEIAQNIESDEEQGNTLKAVVEDLLYLQEWQQALEVIQTIKQPKQRFEALIALIKSLLLVQWMPLREKIELPDMEGELPAISFDMQLSEKERLWDALITTTQQLFEEYRPPAIIVELLQNLGRAGQWDRALKIADTPVLAEVRAEILVAIVYMLAVQQRDKALSLAHTIDVPAQKAEALAILADALCVEQPLLAGTLLNESLAAAQTITDNDLDSSETFASLAFQLSKAGHWEKALTIARSIERPGTRISTLVDIATASIDSDLEQAFDILSETLVFIRSQKVDEQEDLLRVVGKALSYLPLIKQNYALRVEIFSYYITMLLRSSGATEDQGISEYISRLDALAVAIANAEHEEQAEALWAEFEAFLDIGTSLEEEERQQARNLSPVKDTGEEEQEGNTGEDFTTWRYWSRKDEEQDERSRSEVWSWVWHGQSERAADMLLKHMASKRYFNEYEWSVVQRDVASSLASKQQWEKALAIAWSIRSEWQKTQALVAIATTLVHAGQRDKGQLLLLEAEAIAHAIEKDMDRDNAMGDVAEALIEIQELDDAEVVVELIKDALKTSRGSSQKDRSRLLITRALARAQHWDEAKEEAQRIGGFLKVSAMNSITDAMITCGEHQQALQYIQTAWMQTETRGELIQLLPLVKEFIPLHPELGEACYDAFAWVDRFLQA